MGYTFQFYGVVENFYQITPVKIPKKAGLKLEKLIKSYIINIEDIFI